MDALITIAIPLGAALVAGVPLWFVSARWLVRICNVAIVTQVGLTLTAWLLLDTLPQKESRPGEQTCPDFDSTHGDVLDVVAFSSIGVGAIALASAVLTVRRGVGGAGRVLLGLAASGLTFAIFIPYVAVALCGLN